MLNFIEEMLVCCITEFLKGRGLVDKIHISLSTQNITLSTGKRRQLSGGNLIGQHSGSERLSKSDRKAKTS